MAVYTAPGVYIEEVASGVRTITGVSTSTTAFVGRTLKGPVEEPVLISSFGEFTTLFGGLWEESPLSFSVQQFFANGGQLALIVRLTNGAAPAAFQLPAASKTLALEASSPGTWGDNLRISVDANTKDPASLFNLTVADTGKSNGNASGAIEVLRNLSIDPANSRFITTVLKQQSRFLRVAATAATPLPKPDAMLDDRLITIAIHGSPTSGTFTLTIPWLPGGPQTSAGIAPDAKAADVKKAMTDLGIAVNDVDVQGGDGPDNPFFVRFVGALAGRPLQPITVASTFPAPASVSIASIPVPVTTISLLGPPTGGKFTLTLPWLPDKTKNTTADIDFDTTAAKLKTAIGGIADVGAANVEVTGGPADKAPLIVKLFGPAGAQQNVSMTSTSSLTPNTASVNISDWAQVDAGNNGIALTDAVIDDPSGRPGQKGMYALEKADIFNLLVIPPPVLDDQTGISNTIWSAAATYCNQKRAFLIVDPPPGTINPPANATSAGLDTLGFITDQRQYSALFFPRFRATNPLTGLAQEFAPSGAIAGIMARTDADRGVWKAPAGLDAGFSGILELSYKLTEAEIGTLNQLGVNCLRTFRFNGSVVWGARTLDGNDAFASEWKYTPVRRLALFIEESLFRGTQWVVFEPNDEPLWSQIRLNIGAFMHDLFRQGAFQGASPRDAYFVKCDSETTTQTDIDLGIVNIQVGFAPLKPAEFVVIQIQQMAGQIQV